VSEYSVAVNPIKTFDELGFGLADEAAMKICARAEYKTSKDWLRTRMPTLIICSASEAASCVIPCFINP